MNPKIATATALHPHVLALTFANGETRHLDVAPFMARSPHFAQLANGGFAAVRVVFGCLEWPGDVDLSNDTAYLRSIPAPQPATAPVGDVAATP